MNVFSGSNIANAAHAKTKTKKPKKKKNHIVLPVECYVINS